MKEFVYNLKLKLMWFFLILIPLKNIKIKKGKYINNFHSKDIKKYQHLIYIAKKWADRLNKSTKRKR